MKKLFALVVCLLFVISAVAETTDLQKGDLYDQILDQANVQTENEATGENEETPEGSSGADIPKGTDTTVMVYLCGSSLEKVSGNPVDDIDFASSDLNEMMYSGFNQEKVNVIVMAGGAESWHLDVIDESSTGIYRVLNREIVPIASDRRTHNMGHSDTLSGFLRFCYENYPAEKYALIMWDHGGGSINGICEDALYSDSLSMQEVVKGLRESPFGKEKLDWIGFDACLMASVEIAKLISPYADYMIASEESVPGSGWDYSFLKGIENDENSAHTGERIIDAYFDSLRLYGLRNTLTMSCVDLSGIDAVAGAANEFFGDLDVNEENYSMLYRARRDAKAFGRSEEDDGCDFDLVDLGDITEKLADFGNDGSAAQLMRAIEKCVVHNESSEDGCSGMSVYYPFYDLEVYPYTKLIYKDISFSEGYEQFIRDYANYVLNGGQSLWSMLFTLRDEAERDTRTMFSLALTEEQCANFGEAEMIALQQINGEDAWRLVAAQDACIGENGMLSGSYVHTNLFVTGADGQPIHDASILYVEKDNGYYIIPVALISGAERVEAQIVASRDPETDLVTVEDVYPYDEAIQGYSMRRSVSLSDFDAVSYKAVERRKTYNEAGALAAFEDWTVVNTEEFTWNVKDEWQLAFVEDYLDTASISICFSITDIFNNVYMSEPALLDAPLEEHAGIIASYDDDLILIEDVEPMVTAKGNLRLVAGLTNRTDAEALIQVCNVSINGEMTDAGAAIYGNGENGGLNSGENQIMMMSIPAEAWSQVNEIVFDVVMKDAEGNPIGTVAVTLFVSLTD